MTLEAKLQALVVWIASEWGHDQDAYTTKHKANCRLCALEALLAERQEPRREKDWEAAAKQVDWMQILLNLMNGQETGRDGQPCFFIGGGHFCGRAKFWDGHIVTTDGALAHRFVSLLDLLTLAAAQPSSGTERTK